MGACESDVIGARWVDDLSNYVKRYWDHLLNGPWAEGVTNGTLTLPEMLANRTASRLNSSVNFLLLPIPSS